MLAILGGNELLQIPEIQITQRRIIRTPYGLPSSPIIFANIAEKNIIFLIRHGYHRYLAPHEINYRANIWALKEAGAQNVISISSVYGINPELTTGQIIIPHDMIDMTYNRSHTFYENEKKPFIHTEFDTPYSASLRQKIQATLSKLNIPYQSEAIYTCLQGPRLPTAAETKLLLQYGTDVIGMTGMPEAILAQEKNLNYAHVCSIIQKLPFINNTITDQQTHQQILKNIHNFLTEINN